MNCETCHLNELELEPREIKDVLRCILHTIFFHRTLTLVRPKDVDCERFQITYVQCGLPDLEKEVDEKINQFIAWAEKHPNRRSQVCLSFFDEKNKHPGWFSNKTERIYWEQWFINLHVISPKGHGKQHSSKAQTNITGSFAFPNFLKQDDLHWPVSRAQTQVEGMDLPALHSGLTEVVLPMNCAIRSCHLQAGILVGIQQISFLLMMQFASGEASEQASSRHDALGSLIQEVLFQIINYANEKKDHIPPISDRIFNHEISIPSSSDSVFGWNADVLRRALSSGHSYSLN